MECSVKPTNNLHVEKTKAVIRIRGEAKKGKNKPTYGFETIQATRHGCGMHLK